MTLTKGDVLDHFNLWLLDKYEWLGYEQISKIMLKADSILSDADDLEYYSNEGHRVLYNAITGGI
jgi:hypothetical protein